MEWLSEKNLVLKPKIKLQSRKFSFKLGTVILNYMVGNMYGSLDMAKRKYDFDLSKIEKMRAEGRGSGSGSKYIPWIRAQDFASDGLTTRVLGWKSGRDHHLFSKLEIKYFYLLEWSDLVVDIREQFPLEHYATLQFAKEAGVDYPWDRKTGYDVVMTTDFLVTVVDSSGGERHLARTLKYANELRGKRGKSVLAKFEVERRYWLDKGIDWGIVTDLQMPTTLVSNIEDCHAYRDLDSAVNFDAQKVDLVEDLIRRRAEERPDSKLSAFAAMLDRSHSLEPGTSLAVIRYLLANKRLTLPSDIRWLKTACCKDIVVDRGRVAEAV